MSNNQNPEAEQLQRITQTAEELAEAAAKLAAGKEKTYSHTIGQKYDDTGRKVDQQPRPQEEQKHVGTGRNNPTTHFADNTEKFTDASSHSKTSSLSGSFSKTSNSSGSFSGIAGGKNAITGGTANLDPKNFKNSATNDSHTMFSEKSKVTTQKQNYEQVRGQKGNQEQLQKKMAHVTQQQGNSMSQVSSKIQTDKKEADFKIKHTEQKNTMKVQNGNQKKYAKIRASAYTVKTAKITAGAKLGNKVSARPISVTLKSSTDAEKRKKIHTATTMAMQHKIFSDNASINIAPERRKAFSGVSGISSNRPSSFTVGHKKMEQKSAVYKEDTSGIPHAKKEVKKQYGSVNMDKARSEKKQAFSQKKRNTLTFKVKADKEKLVNAKIRATNIGAIQMGHSTVRDNTGTIERTNNIQKKFDIETGAHNAFHVNGDTAGKGMVDLMRSTYDETDYTAGKRQIKKYASWLGLTEVGRVTAKASVKDSMYRTKRRGDNFQQLEKVRAIVGKDYKGKDNRSMNAVKDYDKNMHAIDQKLSALGINSRSYNMGDVKKALNSGFAGSKKSGVRVTDGSEAYILLTEKKKLLKEKGKVSQARGGSAIKNTGKTWMRTASQDTDTYQGAQTVGAAYKGAKAVGWGIKGAAGVAANTAITGAKWSAKASVKITEIGYRRKFSVGYNGKRIPWKSSDAARKFKAQQKAINDISSKAKGQVRRFTTSSAKDKAKFVGKKILGKTGIPKVFNKLMQTRFMKRLNAIRIKAGNIGSFLLKPLKAPIKAFNFIKRVAMKVAVGMAVFMLFEAVFASIICGVAGILPGGFLEKSDSTNTYIGQDTVNYIYKKQILLHDYLATGNWDFSYGDLPDGWLEAREDVEKRISEYKGKKPIVVSVEPIFPAGTDPLNEEPYNAGLIQRAIISCLTEALDNEKDNYYIYLSFADDVFMGAYGNALPGWGKFITFDTVGPDKNGHITINVHYNFSYNYIKELTRIFCNNEKYEDYVPDNNDDGEHNGDDYDGEWSDALYCLSDDDWYDMAQIEFHSFSSGLFSDSELDNIIDQINDNYKKRFNKKKDLSSSRMNFIAAALSCVGRATYSYGGGTPTGIPVTSLEQLPSTCDCSHFVCFALALGGVESYSYRTASNFCVTSMDKVGHDITKLRPGTIISAEKSNGPGTNAHVIIYIGEADLGDGNGKRPLTVECTNATGYGGPNGIQVSLPSRLGVHNNYGWYYQPYFK